VDDFIEHGNREKLMVKLALFLHENQAGDDEISGLLAELINYEDEKSPALSRAGHAEAIANQNKLRRLDLLQRTIANIVPPGSPVETTPEGGKAVQLETTVALE
jgi:hypothetical protein